MGGFGHRGKFACERRILDQPIRQMPLFEFNLHPINEVTPSGGGNDRSLSWFGLTDGYFGMPVGDQVLFQYSRETVSYRNLKNVYADYQIAAFAWDFLECFAAAAMPMPSFFEKLVSNQELLTQLRADDNNTGDEEQDSDVWYNAWRWLQERSPSISFLKAAPQFHFLRVGDNIRIIWNTRDRIVDGIPVWSAKCGHCSMSYSDFHQECLSFKDRLLKEMDQRIQEIAFGAALPQITVDTKSLQQQQGRWEIEFQSYFGNHEPDVSWHDTELALRAIAGTKGITL